MKRLFLAALLAAQVSAAHAATAPKAPPAFPHDPAFLAMLKEMVDIDSSHQSGSCTTVAEKVVGYLKAGGFAPENIHLFIPEGHPKDGNVVAILPGRDPKAAAVLMSGHIDVVNANRADWKRDPFVMEEDAKYYYGRGVADMKAQDAIWIDNLLRYTKEGYRPKRTIKLALTCGEEGGFVNGVGWLLEHQRPLIDAGIAFNEGGYGDLDPATDRKLDIQVLAAEKNGETLILEATNPGGHSSRPRPDNAIYDVLRAVENLEGFQFPVFWGDANRAYFTKIAPVVGGAQGQAMLALLKDPNDKAADAIVSAEPEYNAMLRTTCIPTLLDGGHAGNALPQRARVTVNCRILPGMTKAEVKAAVVKAINNPAVTVTGTKAPDPPITAAPFTKAVLGPMEAVAARVYPGVPVAPFQATGGTDGKRMIMAGIPTYGITGMFREGDFSNAHGENERMRIFTVWEGREYLYQLVKAFAEAPALQ
jgi:acetylornithine deacetylase/succinyl-diaminopimelate desuccinylase-like protein